MEEIGRGRAAESEFTVFSIGFGSRFSSGSCREGWVEESTVFCSGGCLDNSINTAQKVGGVQIRNGHLGGDFSAFNWENESGTWEGSWSWSYKCPESSQLKPQQWVGFLRPEPVS